MIIWSKGDNSSYRDRILTERVPSPTSALRVSDVFPRHPANSKIGVS